MNIKELKDKVFEVLDSITDNDPGTWDTPELNICSHIRALLAEKFPKYNVDVELPKENRMRPDICIHIRDNQEGNLAAFEVKIKPTLKQIESDLKKITDVYFNEPYFYKFGVFICVKSGIPGKLPYYDQDKIAIFTINGYGERKETISKNFQL